MGQLTCYLAGTVLSVVDDPENQDAKVALVRQMDGEIIPVRSEDKLEMQQGDIVRLYGHMDAGHYSNGIKSITIPKELPLLQRIEKVYEDYELLKHLDSNLPYPTRPENVISLGHNSNFLARPHQILNRLAATPDHVAITRPDHPKNRNPILDFVERLAAQDQDVSVRLIDPETISFPEVTLETGRWGEALSLFERSQLDHVRQQGANYIPANQSQARNAMRSPRTITIGQEEKVIVPYPATYFAGSSRGRQLTSGLSAPAFPMKYKVPDDIALKFVAAHEYAHSLKKPEGFGKHQDEVFCDSYAMIAVAKEYGTVRPMNHFVQRRLASFLEAATDMKHTTGAGIKSVYTKLQQIEAEDNLKNIDATMMREIAMEAAETYGLDDDNLEARAQRWRSTLTDLGLEESSQATRHKQLVKLLEKPGTVWGIRGEFRNDVAHMVKAIEKLSYSDAELKEDHNLLQDLIDEYATDMQSMVHKYIHDPNRLGMMLYEEFLSLNADSEGTSIEKDLLAQGKLRVVQRLGESLGLSEDYNAIPVYHLDGDTMTSGIDEDEKISSVKARFLRAPEQGKDIAEYHQLSLSDKIAALSEQRQAEIGLLSERLQNMGAFSPNFNNEENWQRAAFHGTEQQKIAHAILLDPALLKQSENQQQSVREFAQDSLQHACLEQRKLGKDETQAYLERSKKFFIAQKIPPQDHLKLKTTSSVYRQPR